MAPENAGIFYVEDNPDSRETTIEYLENAGHSVPLIAVTLDEALSKIPSMESMGVEIAIVDGNLSPSDISGRDGKLIVEKIRESYGNKITVIGCSSSGLVKGANYNKSQIGNSKQLATFIKNL